MSVVRPVVRDYHLWGEEDFWFASPAVAVPPDFRAATTSDGGLTSVTVDVPTGTVNGDLLLVLLTNAANAAVTWGGLTGWTLVPNCSQSGTAVQSAMYYRVASSEPASYTFTASGGATDTSAVMAAYSGVDTANPIAASNSSLAAATSSAVTPTITPPVDNTLIVAAFTADMSSATTWTANQGTERVDFTTADGFLSSALYDLPQTTAAAISVTGTKTGASADVARYIIALRPVGGGGVTPTVDITTGPDLTRISRVSGKDVSTLSFTASADYQAYKLKIVSSEGDPHTAGLLLETGTGGTGGVARQVDVTDDEIVAAEGGTLDGQKVVKVFVQGSSGEWSS